MDLQISVLVLRYFTRREEDQFEMWCLFWGAEVYEEVCVWSLGFPSISNRSGREDFGRAALWSSLLDHSAAFRRYGEGLPTSQVKKTFFLFSFGSGRLVSDVENVEK